MSDSDKVQTFRYDPVCKETVTMKGRTVTNSNADKFARIIRERAAGIAGDSVSGNAPGTPGPRVSHRDRSPEVRARVAEDWPQYPTAATVDTLRCRVATVDRAGVPMFSVPLTDGRYVWSVFPGQAEAFPSFAAAEAHCERLAGVMLARAGEMETAGRNVQADALRAMAANLIVVE